MGKVAKIPEDKAVLLKVGLPKHLVAKLYRQASKEGRMPSDILAEAIAEKMRSVNVPSSK